MLTEFLVAIVFSVIVQMISANRNPICPYCSMGNENPTMASYGSQGMPPLENPMDAYGGNPATFGTELGRAIGARIQEVRPSFNSYPFPSAPPFYPSNSPYDYPDIYGNHHQSSPFSSYSPDYGGGSAGGYGSSSHSFSSFSPSPPKFPTYTSDYSSSGYNHHQNGYGSFPSSGGGFGNFPAEPPPPNPLSVPSSPFPTFADPDPYNTGSYNPNSYDYGRSKQQPQNACPYCFGRAYIARRIKKLKKNKPSINIGK